MRKIVLFVFTLKQIIKPFDVSICLKFCYS